MRAKTFFVAAATVAGLGTAVAADAPERRRVLQVQEAPCGWWPSAKERKGRAPCVRGAVPTNSPLDPTYVGSGYGLGRPSFFGARPAPGVDAY